MPEDTIDQADQAATLAETADDADTLALGIEVVRNQLNANYPDGSFDTHAKDPVPEQRGGFSGFIDKVRGELHAGDGKASYPVFVDTHAKDPQVEPAKKSPEEIEKILFDDGERDSTAPFQGPAPYVESDAEREKRLEWEARDRRRDACHIAARMHQGRGLNMRDFLDECDVIAEYIRDGYVPDFTA